MQPPVHEPLVSDTPRPGQPSWAARAGLVGLFLLSALAGVAAIDALLPEPRNSGVSTKLQALAQRAADVDTVFVGSSLVFRHVDPALFDRTLAERGIPTRSFNLGVPGMAALEIRHVLSRLATLPGLELRWVILDPLTLDIRLAEANRFTGRVTSWHDLATTWRAVTMALTSEVPWRQRLALAFVHASSFAFQLANLGEARVAFEPWLLGGEADREMRARSEDLARRIELGERGDGFRTLDDELQLADAATVRTLRARRQALLDDEREFARQLRQAPAKRARPGPPLGRAEVALLRELVDMTRAMGAELVFFSGPDAEQRQLYLGTAETLGLLPAYLDLADPATHPQLFDFDLRFDWNHLNADGARLYTLALAEAFADRVDAGGPDGDGR